ncbi:MAG: hypothetical protein ACRC2S_22285 [Waterburya sp.]
MDTDTSYLFKQLEILYILQTVCQKKALSLQLIRDNWYNFIQAIAID